MATAATDKPKCHQARNSRIREILKQWLVVQSKYLRTVRGDIWWQYSERPYTGLLAAAVWMIGGIALEEWKINGRPQYGSTYARNDLWIRYRDTDLVIEAKHKFLIIESERDFKEKIKAARDKLKEAFNESRDVAKEDAPKSKRLGVLFLCCTFRSQVSQDDAIKTRRKWIEHIDKRIKYHGIAWIFANNPKIKSNFWTSDGIIVLVKMSD